MRHNKKNNKQKQKNQQTNRINLTKKIQNSQILIHNIKCVSINKIMTFFDSFHQSHV